MAKELSYEEIKELCRKAMVSELVVLLHSMKSRRRGSRRSKSDVIKLAELSYEIIKRLESAGRLVIISRKDGIKEIIIRPEIVIN